MFTPDAKEHSVLLVGTDAVSQFLLGCLQALLHSRFLGLVLILMSSRLFCGLTLSAAVSFWDAFPSV